jgi:uncharacterized protein YdaU (DUF1376 family)
MNYYEHHIGDYAQATSHLSFLEDAAYSRLLRKYYAEERPLPSDLRSVQRLIGARSEDEREAVEVVLQEFFWLEEDGWHNSRADDEIARFQSKRAMARKSAEARWGARGSPKRHDRDANADGADANACANDAIASGAHGGRNALQTPGPKRQASTKDTHASSERSGDSMGKPAGIAAAALTRLGLRVTSQNPGLIEACAEGVTVEALLEVHHLYPEKPAGYVIATARRISAEARAARLNPKDRLTTLGRPSATDDFQETVYAGTRVEDLPAHLRHAAERAMADR